jgi:hypothetical protein
MVSKLALDRDGVVVLETLDHHIKDRCPCYGSTASLTNRLLIMLLIDLEEPAVVNRFKADSGCGRQRRDEAFLATTAGTCSPR